MWPSSWERKHCVVEERREEEGRAPCTCTPFLHTPLCTHTHMTVFVSQCHAACSCVPGGPRLAERRKGRREDWVLVPYSTPACTVPMVFCTMCLPFSIPTHWLPRHCFPRARHSHPCCPVYSPIPKAGRQDWTLTIATLPLM